MHIHCAGYELTAAKIEASSNPAPRIPNALILMSILFQSVHNRLNSVAICWTTPCATAPGKGSARIVARYGFLRILLS